MFYQSFEERNQQGALTLRDWWNCNRCLCDDVSVLQLLPGSKRFLSSMCPVSVEP